MQKNSWNQINQFFFREIAFLSVLNFFPVQKLLFGHFWNCKKWNFVKKIIAEIDLFYFTGFLNFLTRCVIEKISFFPEINDDLVESEFGYCNGSNADQVIQRGWLTNETVVQLKLFGEKSLNIWKKKYRNREFFVKATPVRANKSNMEDPTVPSFNDDSQSMDMISTRDKFQSWPIVEVAVSIQI